MGTEKRQRQKEGRAKRREADMKAALQARRKTQIIRLAVSLVVVTLVVLAISTFGGDDGDDKAKADKPDKAGTSTTAAKEASGFNYGTGECAPEEKPTEPVRSFEAAPKKCIEDGTDYAAVIATSKGDITVDLDEKAAPGTVNNFVTLARYGYYDGDDFHRVVKNFVIQGGDPVGDPQGTGGPGYAIDDELPGEDNPYVEGSLAMANSGPNTNGSQFFIYTGPNPLGPNYSHFGKVTKGLDAVKAIIALSTGDGPPSEPVKITSVTITETKAP